MTLLVVNAPNGINGAGFSIAALQQLDFDNPYIAAFSPTLVRVNFDDGLSVALTGTGLGFAPGGVSGTVTQLVVLQAGSPIVTMSGFSVAASAVYAAVNAGDYQGLANSLLGGNDTLYGSLKVDTLYGLGGNDYIYGRDGNDLLFGNDGADILTGGAGADRLDGGAGADGVSYAGETVGVRVDLAIGVGRLGAAEGDILVSIENVEGSNAGDTLSGNAGANLLNGGGGNDVVNGGGGNDVVRGNDGNDNLLGGDGSDTLVGGAGADRLDGGAGIDIATYAENTAGVTINLTAGTGVGGTAQGDVLISIEYLIGGSGNDGLIGGAAAETLSGGAGNDTLYGVGGADVLVGGAGADRFFFAAPNQTPVGGFDRITDFSHAQADRIDLAAVDANGAGAGNGTFAFIGTAAFTGVAGQLHYALAGASTVVTGDVNGDRVADFQIILTGAIALQAADFVL